MVVINHRGLAGCELSSPKLYSGESTIDFREPMLHIKKTYGQGRKLMAVGTSLGAHRLCLALGEDGKSSPIHAACCVQAPMKLWKATNSAKYTMKGIYDVKLGENMNRVLMRHKEILEPFLLKEHGIDLMKTLSEMNPIT